MDKIPKWAELVLLKLIKQVASAEVVADLFMTWKLEFIDWAKAQVANTENQVDDYLVEKLSQALTLCDPNSQILCDLVAKGEDAVIELLRGLAAKTETELDDTGVEIFADALKKA